MRPSADVIVIGGGIIGCATACELARRGAKVRVFEARTVAAGATHASAGMLAPYIEAHDRGPLFDLTLRSLDLFDDFVARAVDDSGLSVDYRRTGSLEIATDAVIADTLRQRVRTAPAGSSDPGCLDDHRERAAAPAIASISGAGSNRTGSVHGRPVSRVAASQAARAAASSRS